MNPDLAKIYAFVSIPILISVALFLFVSDDDVPPNRETFRISGREWIAEIVETPEARAKGLSGRDSLCAECGMVFRFDSVSQYGFWMKDMRFPLDIAWVRDGRIVHIEHDVPKDFLRTLVPEEPADTVVEVNAGDLSSVLVGEPVSFSDR